MDDGKGDEKDRLVSQLQEANDAMMQIQLQQLCLKVVHPAAGALSVASDRLQASTAAAEHRCRGEHDAERGLGRARSSAGDLLCSCTAAL